MNSALKRTLILLAASSAFVAVAFVTGLAPVTSAEGQHGDHGAGHGDATEPHAEHHMPVESELDFIAGMIPHHQEAIDSAEEILTLTERPELRTMAEDIIREQQREIALIEEWLAEWYEGEDAQVDYQEMMRPLDGLSAEEAEQVFMEDMIGHHQMAIDMANDLLAGDFETRAEVRTLAEEIIAAQEAEIDQLETWLQDWYGAEVDGVGHEGH